MVFLCGWQEDKAVTERGFYHSYAAVHREREKETQRKAYTNSK